MNCNLVSFWVSDHISFSHLILLCIAVFIIVVFFLLCVCWFSVRNIFQLVFLWLFFSGVYVIWWLLSFAAWVKLHRHIRKFMVLIYSWNGIKHNMNKPLIIMIRFQIQIIIFLVTRVVYFETANQRCFSQPKQATKYHITISCWFLCSFSVY